MKNSDLRRSKKTNMFSVLPLWKKGRRRRFFFFKMAAGHIFQNNRPAYFFKMAVRHTWQFSQQMEKLMRESKNIKCDLSIWHAIFSSEKILKNLGKDHIFLVFLTVFQQQKRRKKQAASKKEAGGDAKHVFFFYFA